MLTYLARRILIMVPTLIAISIITFIIIQLPPGDYLTTMIDRKSTRLNSSHITISYAVFCLKKKI